MLFQSEESNNNFIRDHQENYLCLSPGPEGHVRSFRAVNCPGAKGTDISRVKSGGEGDVNIKRGRHSEEPQRDKHHSLGENGKLFLGLAVFMFVCTGVNSISDDVRACRRDEACSFCLWQLL